MVTFCTVVPVHDSFIHTIKATAPVSKFTAPLIFVEILLRKLGNLLSKGILNEGDISIPHDERKKFVGAFFAETALTAFLVAMKALVAFTPLYWKSNGVFAKNFDSGLHEDNDLSVKNSSWQMQAAL